MKKNKTAHRKLWVLDKITLRDNLEKTQAAKGFFFRRTNKKRTRSKGRLNKTVHKILHGLHSNFTFHSTILHQEMNPGKRTRRCNNLNALNQEIQ